MRSVHLTFCSYEGTLCVCKFVSGCVICESVCMTESECVLVCISVRGVFVYL